MMTEQERRKLTVTLDRAHRHGVHVVCEGMRQDTGETIYFVSSSTDPDRLHIVWLADAQHLACSCVAYHWRPETPCTHRAVCHEYLLQQHVARRTATVPAVEQQDKDTAILRRSNQAFSMMK